MNSNIEKSNVFCGVKDGDTFEVAGMEFIKFPSVGEITPVVMKKSAFSSAFGGNNDLRRSKVLKRMEAEILPKIIEAVGEDNVCEFATDLTTLDGLKPYEEMHARISLPTFDFYRANVEIFDEHKLDEWWWLATPESAAPHSNGWWIVCVSPSGRFSNFNYYYFDCGVRPFCIFKSSIFESCED